MSSAALPALKRLLIDETQLSDTDYKSMFDIHPKVATEPTPDGTTKTVKNMFSWEGCIYGPKDSPYEGGVFHITLAVPNIYPLKPPLFRMETKIYHPNISADGQICLDILKQQWTPALGIRGALLSIIVLLDNPNASDPLNPVAGKQLINNKEEFDIMARTWTAEYAMGF